jgi:uncharacterized membrane protein YedE/YeeE
MSHFTPWPSLAGGIVIGVASGLLLLSSGQIAGISGILAGALTRPARGASWRWAFLAGMLLAGLGLARLWPARFSLPGLPSLGLAGLAGLLVGVGTRLGNGCTSGHGVCGIARRSPRSLVATLTFIITGAVTVFVLRRWFGAAA